MPHNGTIRVVEERDAEAIAAIYAPNVTGTVVSFEMEPPDAAEMGRRIASVTVAYPWLVCERGGEVVGYVYASNHLARAAYQWSVNVTVYVNPKQHRSGVGRALYTSLFAILKLQGFYNAYAGITLPNAGSVGLHEALGFRLVGIYREVGYKFGAWHDVGWWGLGLQPKTGERPVPALEMSKVRSHPNYQAALHSGSIHLCDGTLRVFT